MVWDDQKWLPLGLVYFLYSLLHLAGFFLHSSFFNIAGAALILWVAALTGGGRVKGEWPVVPAFLLLQLPLLESALGVNSFVLTDYIKQAYLLLLFILMRGLPLPPLYRSRYRFLFLAGLSVVIQVSLLLPGRFEGRLSGAFDNPNNFILVTLGLLMLIDEARDRLPLKAALHAVILLVGFVTNTVGAILGYLLSWAFKLEKRFGKAALQGGALVLALGGLAAGFGGWANRLPANSPLQRLYGQGEVIFTNLDDVASSSINYGQVVEAYGTGSSSGIWRLAHWYRCFQAYRRWPLENLLLGCGIGRFRGLFGDMAHNDYLRILVEQGAAGFCLFGWLVLSLARGVPRLQGAILVAYLVYSFSDNNLDNILFMSLWIMFLASASSKPWEEQPAPAPEGWVVPTMGGVA